MGSVATISVVNKGNIGHDTGEMSGYQVRNLYQDQEIMSARDEHYHADNVQNHG
jgi:hypothetical protein